MTRAAIAALAVSVLFVPQAALAHSGVTLRGYGTATIDGVFTPGEWDRAGRYDFAAPLPAEYGGGSVPGTLYMMSDPQSLYLAMWIASPSLNGTTSFLGSFGNQHNGFLFQEGDDVIVFERNPVDIRVYDSFIHLIPNGFCWCRDTDYGGTADVSGTFTSDGVASYYELSHPLNTGDDAHDFSLGLGQRVNLGFDYLRCGATECAATRVPPVVNGAPADFVVVSTDHTPPDTQLVGGPAEGSVSGSDYFEFTFTGSDAGIPPEALLYECKLDGGAYEPCRSPHTLRFVNDGPHVFSVRAVDDWDLTDPTPPERHWTVDSGGPTPPRVRGPRVTRTRSPTFRFSATDAVTPPEQIRYRCAFDRRLLHPCATPYRQRLRVGRHVLRVRALDASGHKSPLVNVKVQVKKRRSR